jgi:hypothetical protein
MAVTMKNSISWAVAPCFCLVRANVLVEHVAAFFRVERISEIGTTLAITWIPYYY